MTWNLLCVELSGWSSSITDLSTMGAYDVALVGIALISCSDRSEDDPEVTVASAAETQE